MLNSNRRQWWWGGGGGGGRELSGKSVEGSVSTLQWRKGGRADRERGSEGKEIERDKIR